ncbi:MAG: hypothetical protein Q9191_000112 [Dirinaria sp. TL-2023a]
MDAGGPASKQSKKIWKGRKGEPEMTMKEVGQGIGHQRPRGLSMDMDIGSPYVLPPGLHGSRESLHSMSRTIHSGDDRYRPATIFQTNDTASTHSYPSRRAADDSSSYTGSGSSGRKNDGMNQNLLRNAQRMSRSVPPTSRSPVSIDSVSQIRPPQPALGVPRKGLPPKPVSAGLAPPAAADPRDSSTSKDGVDLRKSNNYLGPLIHSREPSADVVSQTPGQSQRQSPIQSQSGSLHSASSSSQQSGNRKSPPVAVKAKSSAEFSRPPRTQSLKAASHSSQELNFFDDESDYGDGFKVTPPSPKNIRSRQPSVTARVPDQGGLPPVAEHVGENLGEQELGFDIRRLSMGVRPLPPDDPHDNPEQRANRIRSFYKEYFDESKAGPQGAGQYYEDYDGGYLGDGAIFDPASGQFVTAHAPYAVPYGRRAMTPPPRTPPRFRGAARHHATMSGSGFAPVPRAFSSASGRFGPNRGRGPQKPPPLPQPLKALPSPHMLKEDAFALPIDFAPPGNSNDRANGRADSPRGGFRPYSPRVPAQLPLVSSFDDLSVMPSPHMLRKSGTFTSLDFAPPPRFPGSATASDAGSIRSNRSAMSERQLYSIRSGAYRVSRIPKEVVGTRHDFSETLKPQWDLNR